MGQISYENTMTDGLRHFYGLKIGTLRLEVFILKLELRQLMNEYSVKQLRN